MKVLIVNTFERRGGAAVAANRLTVALRHQGVSATMLVRSKISKAHYVVGLDDSFLDIARFVWERLCIMLLNRFNKKDLFAVSLANTGVDITKLPEFKEADIIHLHWINQGMISLKGVRKIMSSGKPVIWTMHDMWPCTGICHHARECDRFTAECGHCPFIRDGKSAKDISYINLKRKKKICAKSKIAFIACSRWLLGKAQASTLLKDHDVISIPNPIDTSLFCRKDKNEARQRLSLPTDKKLVLFGSVKTTDKRKGIDYFIDACNNIVAANAESKKQIALVVCGESSVTLRDKLPFDTYSLPYINSDAGMVDVYNAVDVYVTPSLEENLPNMIMEAMACGVPCVGFEVGGIPEMIDHLHNGYVAKYRSAEDLAKGIRWILFEDDYAELSDAALRKAHETYAEREVARQYIEVYNKLMK